MDGKPCEKNHPPQCFRYTRFGARNPKGWSKGTKCQYWHPRLCSKSVKNKYCSKDDCTFFHIKGTIRSSTEQENDRNVNQRNHQTGEGSFIPPHSDTYRVISIFGISDTTPYPPTVDVRDKKATQSFTDSGSFLLQKMET